MENRKGLSDVVTTVIIVALSLVAITVVWVVVQQLITSNTDSAKNQQTCLESRFEVTGVNSAGKVTVSAKRLSGSTVLTGVNLFAYNATSSANSTSQQNLNVGAVVSKEITISSATSVSAVPYFKSGSTIFYCDPIKADIA